MLDLDDFASEVCKNSDHVKKLSKPLQTWGVSYFYYFSMTNGGDCILLSSRPELEEYYLTEKIYLNDPYIRHPNNFRSGFFFFDTFRKEEYEQSLAIAAQPFGVFPLLCYCKKNKDSAEFFGFWGDVKEAPSFEYIYLNHPNLLKSFSQHFKNECQSILLEKESKSASFKNLIGADLFDFKPSSKKAAEESLRAYLMGLGMGAELAKFEVLSQRERQCLKSLLVGKSAKETAFDLKLSSRTVEFYLENIKNKLDCHSKYELFSIAENFRYLNLLD